MESRISRERRGGKTQGRRRKGGRECESRKETEEALFLGGRRGRKEKGKSTDRWAEESKGGPRRGEEGGGGFFSHRRDVIPRPPREKKEEEKQVGLLGTDHLRPLPSSTVSDRRERELGEVQLERKKPRWRWEGGGENRIRTSFFLSSRPSPVSKGP